MNTSKILVVDDEEDLREALRTSLTTAGCSVVVAKDGAEGLSQALLYKPDLILLDINMPNMNGHQVLRELRRDAWGNDSPIETTCLLCKEVTVKSYVHSIMLVHL